MGLAWAIPVMTAMTLSHWLVGTNRTEWLTRIYTRVQIKLTGSRWRAVVDPAVRPDRPYVFMQNHTNHFDHAVMYCATPHIKQGIELAKHFRYPFYGWMMRSRGTIPIHGSGRNRRAELLQSMQTELQRGRSILVFPEGTRTRDGKLGRFRRGIFELVAELGVPIVPVTVTGTFAMMRKGSWLIRPGQHITVYCDAPIGIATGSRQEIDAAMGAIRAAMAQRLGDETGWLGA